MCGAKDSVDSSLSRRGVVLLRSFFSASSFHTRSRTSHTRMYTHFYIIIQPYILLQAPSSISATNHADSYHAHHTRSCDHCFSFLSEWTILVRWGGSVVVTALVLSDAPKALMTWYVQLSIFSTLSPTASRIYLVTSPLHILPTLALSLPCFQSPMIERYLDIQKYVIFNQCFTNCMLRRFVGVCESLLSCKLQLRKLLVLQTHW